MKRILVIEDEPDIQEMLCAYLRDAGYSVSAASDGIRRWTVSTGKAGI